MRGWWVAAVWVAALACGGAEPLAEGLLGADVKTGAEAALPADFPLDAPVGVTLHTVLTADLLGQHTVTAVFTLDPGTALDAVLGQVEAEMEAEGLSWERAGDRVSATTDDGVRIVVDRADVEGAPAVSVIVSRTAR